MIYHNILENGRVLLRALEPSDVDALYRWENDTDIWIVSSTITPFSRDLLKKYIETSDQDIYSVKQLRLVIEAKDQGNIAVGAIDLFDFDPNNRRAGVGVLIDPAQRGKKYGYEALGVLIKYSFSVLNLHQLYANVLEENKPGISLFEKCGFHIIGVKRDWVRSPNGWLNEYLMQKISE